MSQDYQQGIYSFSNEFERSQQEQHHQQIRRDKVLLRDQGDFDPPPPPPIVGNKENESGVVLPVYETVGMLSEMFSFPSGGVPTATELLESQISQSYRNQRQMPPPTGAANSSTDWFLHRQGMVVGGGLGDSKNQISNINNADPAAAMQLFLMNSQQQQRSPSPSSNSHHYHPPPTSSTLHMLLPNHSSSPNSSNLQAFHNAPGVSFGQFTWGVPNSEDETNPNGVMEGQGLSLSLSSSLQHLEAVKAEELRMREGEMLCFGQGGGPSNNSLVQYQFKKLNAGSPASSLHLQGGVVGQNYHLKVGLGSSLGTVNILRNSKYAKAAQELLEEFCNVGRSQFKKNKLGQQNHNSNNANPSGGGAGGVNSSSSSKDLPPLSSADRLENQRRKIKLISMVDEVDRRYSHYCEQMQMVVNSFDMVMGFGSAVPYTCLAQKAMSRHFRCLKDAISAHLKHTCELLGEKDGGTSGITKGETPRLKILEQSLRQQRAFHQMGMMQQEAWRPQRGLPDRSVNILRAWLFEHFLHPYPSDADKHLLARQTSLSRNQVSNWFINARVRLWKPMVEDMYQQEAKDQPDPQRDHSGSDSGSSSAEVAGTNSNNAQTSTPHAATTTTTAIIPPPAPKKSHEINAPESDPSFIAINNRQRFSENQASFINTNNNATISSPAAHSFPAIQETDSGRTRKPGNGQVNESSTLIRFGANAGDVSLTLGLRHAGNLPEKNWFSIRDFRD